MNAAGSISYLPKKPFKGTSSCFFCLLLIPMVGLLLCLHLVLKDVLLRGLAIILWAVTITVSLAISFLCMLYGLNQGLMKTP